MPSLFCAQGKRKQTDGETAGANMELKTNSSHLGTVVSVRGSVVDNPAIAQRV
jgi:hypothetical protein